MGRSLESSIEAWADSRGSRSRLAMRAGIAQRVVAGWVMGAIDDDQEQAGWYGLE